MPPALALIDKNDNDNNGNDNDNDNNGNDDNDNDNGNDDSHSRRGKRQETNQGINKSCRHRISIGPVICPAWYQLVLTHSSSSQHGMCMVYRIVQLQRK